MPKRIPETPANLEPDSPGLPSEDASVMSRPRGHLRKTTQAFAGRVDVSTDQECPFYSNRHRCRLTWSSILLEGGSEQRERAVHNEIPQRLPRTDPVDPREGDQGDKPDDLAGLDVGVVEQRVEPPGRVERGHREGPSVRRVPHDGRLDPDHVAQ